MKTARDLLVEVAGLPSGHTSNCQDFTEIRLLPAIEARDSEWRRLVEEAQQRSAAYDNDRWRFAAEVDRLKDELAEAIKTKDVWHQLADDWEKAAHSADKKLAEARSRLALVPKICREDRAVTPKFTRLARLCSSIEAYLLAAPPAEHPYPGHCLECSPMQVPQGMAAAPPAEQARVASWKVELDEAEQAQGEAALTLEVLDEVLRDHINDEYNRSTEFAKRVKGLEDRMDKQEAIGGPNWSVGREAEHFVTGRGREPAPPPPEAAGPGHAFKPPLFCLAGPLLCDVLGCNKTTYDPIHAVPPIPEGT
jgi:hypothetical protein